MISIVDLTRARPGTEQAIINGALSQEPFQDAESIECYLRSSQHLPSASETVRFERLDSQIGSNETLIANHIYERASLILASGGSIVIASFRAGVRAVTEILRRQYPDQVQYALLSSYARADGTSTSWDDAFMPLDDAVSALLYTLSKAPTTRMTDLRPALMVTDPRFAKIPGTFNARPGFISSLVGEANLRGLIRLSDNAPGSLDNPLVELTPRAREYTTASPITPSRVTLEPRDAHSGPDRKALPHSLSDNYIDILRKRNLGPFQEVRWAVYDEIEKTLADGPATIYILVRDAVAAVRDNRAAELVRTSKPFPWSKARSFIGTLVSRVPVFLCDGVPTQYSWNQVSLRVDGLIENWRFELDGELVCSLLEDGADVSLNDIASLAGALYNSRRDEFQDRALAVVQHLLSTGRVVSSPSEPTQICLVDNQDRRGHADRSE